MKVNSANLLATGAITANRVIETSFKMFEGIDTVCLNTISEKQQSIQNITMEKSAKNTVISSPTGLSFGALNPIVEKRARELGIIIGTMKPGEYNAITDVKGVKVGHVTKNFGEGPLVPGKGPARTGVTAIVPQEGDTWTSPLPAGGFVLNGCGDVTGMDWVTESGRIEVPILLTNTLCLGRVTDGLVSYMLKTHPEMGINDNVVTPVVGECDDSWLNDIRGRHITDDDVIKAIEDAKSGPVEEGAVGAGTGMISFGFKAGIGTSSRVLPSESGGYTVGVLVNSNTCYREDLVINGVPAGRELLDIDVNNNIPQGSIVITVATDAPLDSRQLSRLSKRAAMGLAKCGSYAGNGSGDFVIAFSTVNGKSQPQNNKPAPVEKFDDYQINPLFKAVEEATEEAVINSLLMAKTTIGRDDHKIEGIPINKLLDIMKKYNRLG